MSNGNANTTISGPGSDWHVLWSNGPRLGDFQLDIVGFLAVLGEGSVAANAQVSALSYLFYLPRLIPAPQALLLPNRPATLPEKKATVTGVESGQTKEHIHHVAHVLLGGQMPPFTVRCVRVTKNPTERTQKWYDRWFRGEQSQSKQSPSKQTQSKPIPMNERARRRSQTRSPTMGPPLITAKLAGPLSWVTLLGCFLSIALFVNSMVWGDGMSLVATLLLSFLSTLIGFVNKWTLKLPQRPPNAGVSTNGNVVIRYPNGSYLVVKCDEEVARELYFAPEEIDYNIKNPAIYRLISLVGTLMLMLGIVALANAKLQMQFAWAGAYIIINIGHWVAAAVPAQRHWDLSCYTLEEYGVATERGDNKASNPHFTEALFKAILFAKSAKWVRPNQAAPISEVWNRWLSEAESIARDLKTHHGRLTDPMWPSKEPRDGIIYDIPKEWDSKNAWNLIQRQVQNEVNV